MSNEPINTGIPFGNALPIHIASLYDIEKRIASIIEFGSTTGARINYDGVKALVELAIASIPDNEQATNLRMMLANKENEIKQSIAKSKGYSTPTSDDEQEAIRSSSFAVLNVVFQIFDDDIGIRKRISVGFA